LNVTTIDERPEDHRQHAEHVDVVQRQRMRPVERVRSVYSGLVPMSP
jgi:hypothetical protein